MKIVITVSADTRERYTRICLEELKRHEKEIQMENAKMDEVSAWLGNDSEHGSTPDNRGAA